MREGRWRPCAGSFAVGNGTTLSLRSDALTLRRMRGCAAARSRPVSTAQRVSARGRIEQTRVGGHPRGSALINLAPAPVRRLLASLPSRKMDIAPAG